MSFHRFTDFTNLNSSSYITGAFYGLPVKKSDVIYGTPEHPYGGVRRGHTNITGYNQGEFIYYDTNRTTYVYRVAYYEEYTGYKYINYPSAIYEDPNGTGGLDLTRISGRYRTTGAKTPTLPSGLVYTYIPVNFVCKTATENIDCIGLGIMGSTSRWIETNVPTTATYLFAIPKGGSWSNKFNIYEYSSGNIPSVVTECELDFGSGKNIPTIYVDYLGQLMDYIYENKFTVKSQNGTEDYTSINEAPPMVSGILSVAGNIKTLILTGGNGSTYTLEWESKTPDGKQFTGISFSPNSKIANIPIGVETYFNLEGDVSLYESYGIYRPPVTTFNVNLYQNTAEANRVDKTNYITEVTTISGVLRDESSITDATITFESESIPTFNYVYIPVFNRYYFVNDITSLKYKLWQMSLSVDPLMTYKDAILSCNGFIDRNESEYNSNIIDKKRVVAQGHTVQVDSVTNELFTASSGTYVLNGLLVSVYTE